MPNARIGLRMGVGEAQGFLRLIEPFRQGEGEAEVRQNRRLPRVDLERFPIEGLGGSMVAHLVGDRALGRQDRPIGLFGPVGLLQHFGGFRKPSGVRQRLAITA